MNTTFGNDPISKVTWINVDNLKSNNYNPNVVLNQELKLLEFSILKNGWIQPILPWTTPTSDMDHGVSK